MIDTKNTLSSSVALRSAESLKAPEMDKSSPLYQASVEFESLFVKQMLDAMRRTIDKSQSLIDGGMAQDIFEDMLYDRYALQISQSSQLGLARTLYLQLSQIEKIKNT